MAFQLRSSPAFREKQSLHRAQVLQSSSSISHIWMSDFHEIGVRSWTLRWSQCIVFQNLDMTSGKDFIHFSMLIAGDRMQPFTCLHTKANGLLPARQRTNHHCPDFPGSFPVVFPVFLCFGQARSILEESSFNSENRFARLPKFANLHYLTWVQ